MKEVKDKGISPLQNLENIWQILININGERQSLKGNSQYKK